MKKISVLIVAVFAVLSSYAQNDAISTLFTKYSQDDNFTKVSVSSKMFELFTHIEPGDEDEEVILEAISKLKGLKALIADSIQGPKELYKEAVGKINSSNYEELMDVQGPDEDMKFMIKESGGVINELVMIVRETNSFAIICLYGEINLKSISKLSKSLNIDGVEHLEHIDNEQKKKG